jgi:hypothetical protein
MKAVNHETERSSRIIRVHPRCRAGRVGVDAKGTIKHRCLENGCEPAISSVCRYLRIPDVAQFVSSLLKRSQPRAKRRSRASCER